MIRINLLAVDRERAKRRVSFQVGQKLTIACSLILLATALLIGWWYWSLRQRAAQLDDEILSAQRETIRLRSVLEQVKDFETRRAQLQQRVALIEQLRKGQSGPVHLLDEVSRSLPDLLWLTELKQQGSDITLEGRTSSLTALSDFVGNLEASGYFKKPVEILNSQVEPQQQGDLIRFSVKAQFSLPGN
ncbi:MAG: PilN domain-containing protein [Acidobacteria bacterium]|nr:PilN domain-containing protein [Acidobacteriota bacterium]